MVPLRKPIKIRSARLKGQGCRPRDGHVMACLSDNVAKQVPSREWQPRFQQKAVLEL